MEQLLEGGQSKMVAGSLASLLFLDKVLFQMVPCVLAANLDQVSFFTNLRHDETDLLFLLLFFQDERSQRLLFLNANWFLKQNFIRYTFKGFDIVFFEHSGLQACVAFSVGIVHVDMLGAEQLPLAYFEDDTAAIILSCGNRKNITIRFVTCDHFLPFSIAFQTLNLCFYLSSLFKLQLPGIALHGVGE